MRLMGLALVGLVLAAGLAERRFSQKLTVRALLGQCHVVGDGAGGVADCREAELGGRLSVRGRLPAFRRIRFAAPEASPHLDCENRPRSGRTTVVEYGQCWALEEPQRSGSEACFRYECAERLEKPQVLTRGVSGWTLGFGLCGAAALGGLAYFVWRVACRLSGPGRLGGEPRRRRLLEAGLLEATVNGPLNVSFHYDEDTEISVHGLERCTTGDSILASARDESELSLDDMSEEGWVRHGLMATSTPVKAKAGKEE